MGRRATPQQPARARGGRRLGPRLYSRTRRHFCPHARPASCRQDCYRTYSGSTSELVLACSRKVQDLDKCAAAVRGAAMAKIVPGSLQQ